jgi:hypothetical protein
MRGPFSRRIASRSIPSCLAALSMIGSTADTVWL